jgi:hypothetical protein
MSGFALASPEPVTVTDGTSFERSGSAAHVAVTHITITMQAIQVGFMVDPF